MGMHNCVPKSAQFFFATSKTQGYFNCSKFQIHIIKSQTFWLKLSVIWGWKKQLELVRPSLKLWKAEVYFYIWVHDFTHTSKMQQVELEKNTIYTTSSIFTKKGSLLLYSYNLAFPPHHYCIGWKEV